MKIYQIGFLLIVFKKNGWIRLNLPLLCKLGQVYLNFCSFWFFQWWGGCVFPFWEAFGVWGCCWSWIWRTNRVCIYVLCSVVRFLVFVGCRGSPILWWFFGRCLTPAYVGTDVCTCCSVGERTICRHDQNFIEWVTASLFLKMVANRIVPYIRWAIPTAKYSA